MHLITMAHLGEAQGVIDLFKLTRMSPTLFEGDNLTCLITGEGPFEAAIRAASVLPQKKYTQVINLGIAGTLNPGLPIASIQTVRSVYLAINGKPQFKSFKSSDQGVDCVTSFERILDPQKAVPLSGVAELVDREAWGVAMAAKEAQIPFRSYKLISDQAGTLGACESVKESVQDWSAKLALHLQELLNISKPEMSPLTLEGFYFTFSTEHQFKLLLKKIALRDNLDQEAVLSSLPTEVIASEIALPKERSKKLIQFLEEKLDPMKKSLETGLMNWKRPFESQGITLQTDQTWESDEVRVSFSVTTQEDLEKKIAALKSLTLGPFSELRSGNTYVE